MSDGPIKLAPRDGTETGDAPALDDIILGDDDQTAPSPPVAPKHKSTAPPATTLADRVDATIKDVGADDRSVARRERSSNRVKAADPAKDIATRETRKRQKMTLRIPDDEVSRPQLPATTPMGGVPAVGNSRPPSSPELGARAPSSPAPDEIPPAPPMRAQRIISIGSPEDTLELPASDLEARGNTVGRAPGIDNSQEAGWTPYQPQVADRADFGGDRIVTRDKEAAAAAAQVAMREPLHTILDEPGMGAMGMMMHENRTREEAAAMRNEEVPSVPPVSEDIPIDTDDDDDDPILLRSDRERDHSDELATRPRLPAATSSDDIKIEEMERVTDPGEAPDEIGAEDLMSVESIPSPHSPHAPPPLKGPNPKLGITPAPPVTATSLMSGVESRASTSASTGHAPPAVPPHPPSHPPPQLPQAAHAPHQAHPGSSPPQAMPHSGPGSAPLGPHGVTPIAPAVAMKQQSAPPPAPSSPSAVSAPQPPPPVSVPQPEPNPAAGTPMARRQQPAGGPFGFMPQVGALAPPAMNESAAHRKKTRPWWEDLFNDDFIRTMAKITDADIAREANFIEESLGCEAGATILDLACGTGRHAVELAMRGYQVVGFDLSLAMLARASDEAQDRKQKINFVQGDMREMTFEETFDGVFSWNTSFGYFDEEKNAAVIAKVHRSLKKGGQFLLDVVNRDSLIRSAPSLAWFEGDGCICMDEMQIDFITSRMRVKRTLMMDDGRTKEIEYSIRVYSLHELGKMLHDNGFRVAEVSGRTGTPGVFFGCESPRTLILAEKR